METDHRQLFMMFTFYLGLTDFQEQCKNVNWYVVYRSPRRDR
jgi:hypothetical protein